MCVEAVLVRNVRREHLAGTSCGQVLDLFLRFQYLDALGECRTEPHHVHRNVKDDCCLVSVGGTAVDFGAFLAISQVSRSAMAVAVQTCLLCGYLDVCRVELPSAVGLEDSEDVPENLFLPVDQFKGPSRTCALGMAEALHERHGKICGVPAVIGILRHEPCRLVFL